MGLQLPWFFGCFYVRYPYVYRICCGYRIPIGPKAAKRYYVFLNPDSTRFFQLPLTLRTFAIIDSSNCRV